MKLPFDESLSPKLVEMFSDLFPGSESALRNGLARQGDLKILEYAAAGNFILVSTDRDFAVLLNRVAEARVVILGSCNYPTGVFGVSARPSSDISFCAVPRGSEPRREPLVARP